MHQALAPFVDQKSVKHDGYFIDPKTEIIYYRKRHNGELIKFSTKIKSNILQAKAFANKELKKRLGLDEKKGVRKLIGEEMDLYVAAKTKEELSLSTMKNVCNAIKQLKPWWKDKHVEEINIDTWLEYCDWFRHKYPDFQLENALKYFRNFCTFLTQPRKNRPARLGSVPRLFAPDAKQVKAARKQKKQRIIEPHEFWKIMNVCDERQKIICALMYTMAFRINEACALKKENLDLNHKPPLYRFRFGTNKANLDGCDSIHELVLELLIPWLEKSREDSPYVFPQKNNPNRPIREQMLYWRDIRRAANLGWHWTPHTFRHSCLTKLFMDERVKDSYVIKTKRISLREALETYIHVTQESLSKFQNAMEIR